MFAIQTVIKYTKINTGRYLFLGAIIFVMAVTSVIAYRISNTGLSDMTGVDTIELTCDINVIESDKISIYKLTVAGYLRADDANTEGIPPVAVHSFDLFINGTIERIENIGLSMHISGDTEAAEYHLSYAVLEKVDINRNSR